MRWVSMRVGRPVVRAHPPRGRGGPEVDQQLARVRDHQGARRPGPRAQAPGAPRVTTPPPTAAEIDAARRCDKEADGASPRGLAGLRSLRCGCSQRAAMGRRAHCDLRGGDCRSGRAQRWAKDAQKWVRVTLARLTGWGGSATGQCPCQDRPGQCRAARRGVADGEDPGARIGRPGGQGGGVAPALGRIHSMGEHAARRS